GSFTITKLPAPATYELIYAADKYKPVTTTEMVAGGERHIANTVLLSSANGRIFGRVTDGKNALGGVTVATVSNGKPVTATTPTIGAVGQFVLTSLPSPNTYVVRFTKKGFGTRTLAINLTPGEAHDMKDVALAGGTGTIAGTVLDATTRQGVGNATVTVDGG